MKSVTKLQAAMGLFFLAGTVSAAPITGSIAFSTAPGATWQPVGANVITATGVDFIAGPSGFEGQVTQGLGDYAGTVDEFATFYDFLFATASGDTQWEFTDGGGTSYSLVMDTLTIDLQNNSSIVLSGVGTLAATAFDPTVGTWDMSLNRSGGAFSFSSSATTVPEPGIVLLLGLGALGAGLARRTRRFS